MESFRAGMVLALVACSTAPIRLDERALADASREENVATPSNGANTPGVIWLMAVDDSRVDQTLGIVGGRPVSAGNLRDWLGRELTARASRWGVAWGRTAPPGARVAMRLWLRKAVVSSVSTTLTAAVVVEVEVGPPGGVFARRFHRGQATALNWASGEGEIADAFRTALEKCLDEVVTDMVAQVGG